MNVNLKQLETFMWVVRLGSFGAAAARLYTTQSTVSVRIHELEAHMGVSLFERSHNRATLTDKGRELLPYAEQLTALTTEIHQRIGLQSVLAGIARVGVAELVAITWLPTLAKAAREKYPGINLELTVDLTQALVAKLREGELDLALLPGPVTLPDAVEKSLGKVEFRWIAGGALDVPERVLTPQEVARVPVIGLAQESHHQRSIQEWFGDIGYNRVTSCNHMGAVIALTRAGRGVSLLPLIACAEDIEAGRLRVLRTRPKMRPVEFFAVYRKAAFQPIAHAITTLAAEVSGFAQHRPVSEETTCK